MAVHRLISGLPGLYSPRFLFMPRCRLRAGAPEGCCSVLVTASVAALVSASDGSCSAFAPASVAALLSALHARASRTPAGCSRIKNSAFNLATPSMAGLAALRQRHVGADPGTDLGARDLRA
eukprot:scaffold17636_cov120-Isochrysis_galbana.AAC.7